MNKDIKSRTSDELIRILTTIVKKCRILIFLLFILRASSFELRASSPGTSSADFLNIGIGARQAGMGEAAVGLADDVSALYWNPAGLGSLAQQELGFMHTQWLDGITYEYLAYAHPVKSLGTFAGHFSLLNYGSIPSFDEGGASLGQTSARDTMGAVGWGSPLVGDRLRIGLSSKWIVEKLASFSAHTVALDVGGLVSVWESPQSTVQLGGGIRNLGSGLKFVSETNPLPQTLYLGLGLKALHEKLAVALDGNLPRDSGLNGRLGIEYWIHPLVAFRAGFTQGRKEAGTGINSGIGLQIGQWHLDYAFSDFGKLGFAHRAEVRWKFGGFEEESYEEGRVLMKHGRPAEAILKFYKVLQMNPRHKRAILRLKECRDMLGTEQELLKETKQP
ncbi:MAG: PorV/PorQ family protein [Elusimicrobia bacterium]|nr:PorV/PorQ family protein [Elusimicrobiota bacterium]